MAHDDSDMTVFLFPAIPEPACQAGEPASAPTCGKDAIGDYANRVGDGCKTVHGWVRLPQSPLIGYG